MIAESIGKVVFEKTLSELFNYLQSKSSLFKKQKLNVNNAWLKASNVENVKTIWQVDKQVNLNNFYCASKIIVDGVNIEVNSLNDLPENGKVVIQGIAGQGKSIFLRYLTGKELKTGSTLPIFIELRRVSEKVTIEDLIISHLTELGIESDSSNLKHIFESNKCTLILDAFDEVPSNEVKDLITYIDGLCSSYHSLRIIISARPNTDIQHVSYFRVVELASLAPSDFPNFFDKLFCGDKQKIDEILGAIHKNKGDIVNLIKTPLLLTLLVITYKSYNKIPEKLHEFYEHLFHLLVNRHDSTKPGFKREFLSGLNENQLENLFSAFCFYCMLENTVSLSNQDAVTCVKKAKEIMHMDAVCEADFLTDSVKNTCLIIKDGFEYHFLHKSIREYYAASFIKNSALILKEKFYNIALKNMRIYAQELRYLQSIDSFYFNKLFLLPYYEGLFSRLTFNGTKVENTELILDGWTVSYDDGDDGDRNNASSLGQGNSIFFDEFKQRLPHIVIQHIFSADIPEEYAKGKHENISAEAIFSGTSTFDEIVSEINQYLSDEYMKYKTIVEKVNKEERIINELGF